jgi:hypothetical protein
MSYTNVQIANLALAKIGDEGGQITSFDQQKKEANLVKKFYEPSLREVLRLHAWNCAKARSQLAQSVTTPTFGFKYQYALPADCIRVLKIARSTDTQQFYREKLEYEINGRMLLTNYDPIYLLYIKYITDPNQMDDLFIRALYTTLAAKLAYPLTEDSNLVRMLEDELSTVIMPEARRVNSFEGHRIAMVDSEWIEASFTSASNTANSLPAFEASNYGVL